MALVIKPPDSIEFGWRLPSLFLADRNRGKRGLLREMDK